MIQTKVVEKTKIHILRPKLFFYENRAVYNRTGTYGELSKLI